MVPRGGVSVWWLIAPSLSVRSNDYTSRHPRSSPPHPCLPHPCPPHPCLPHPCHLTCFESPHFTLGFVVVATKHSFRVNDSVPVLCTNCLGMQLKLSNFVVRNGKTRQGSRQSHSRCDVSRTKFGPYPHSNCNSCWFPKHYWKPFPAPSGAVPAIKPSLCVGWWEKPRWSASMRCTLFVEAGVILFRPVGGFSNPLVSALWHSDGYAPTVPSCRLTGPPVFLRLTSITHTHISYSRPRPRLRIWETAVGLCLWDMTPTFRPLKVSQRKTIELHHELETRQPR